MTLQQINSLDRLQNEKKHLKNDLPAGFFARPVPKLINGQVSKELDYFVWICGIPGKAKTLWEGATLTMYMFFSSKYPAEPPKCQFDPPLPHPNIYPSGSVCLSLINPTQGWKPQTTIKEVLLGIQMLLNEPNLDSPAQQEAFDTLKNHKKKYDENIIRFCQKYPSEGFEQRITQMVKMGEFRTTPRGAPQQQRRNDVIDV